MYLINTSTYKLEQYVDPAPYAILSHTWHDGEEVLHRGFIEDLAKARTKNGFRKIEYLCTEAVRNGLNLAWIDTVCIDKTSSAELSEAINSMFAWYREAKICYVYLDDVDQVSDIPHCRWITRGWTLQELLAPETVHFFNRDWTFIGTKSTLATDLARCTRIDSIALTDATTIPSHSAATRMSWAANRQTTRVEDMAYCLLGIFNVNMPLLYGERDKAFLRLQEQILRQHQDITLLAFSRSGLDFDGPNLLARSPYVFGQQNKIVAVTPASPTHCEVTSRGLQLRLRLLNKSRPEGSPNLYVILDCRYEFDLDHLIAIPVLNWTADGDETSRSYLVDNQSLRYLKHNRCLNLPREDMLMLFETKHVPEDIDLQRCRTICLLEANIILAHSFEVIYAEPRGGVDSWQRSVLVSEVISSRAAVIRKFAFVHEKHDEAFIVMVAMERLWGHMQSQTHAVWCNTEVKPREVGCDVWLKQRNMYDVLEQPSSTSWYHVDTMRTEDIKVVHGVTWRRIDIAKDKSCSTMSLWLRSQHCFEKVDIKISFSEVLSSCLVIQVEPGKHVDSIR